MKSVIFFLCTKHYLGDVEEDEMGTACGMHGNNGNSIVENLKQPERTGSRWEKRLILKRTLHEQSVTV